MQKEKKKNTFVHTAESRLKQQNCILKDRILSALTTAKAHIEEKAVLITLKRPAQDAETNTSATNIHTANTVRIAGVFLDTQEDVYNMEVDDNHNFAVNGGIVIHNCDSMRYLVHTYRLAQPRRKDYISPFRR